MVCSQRFDSLFALPIRLRLPVFGYAPRPLTRTNWKSPGLAVAPTLSIVVAFSLGPTGALLSSSVSVSFSLSAGADTSVLAAVATAAATHAFPSMPAQAPIGQLRRDCHPLRPRLTRDSARSQLTRSVVTRSGPSHDQQLCRRARSLLSCQAGPLGAATWPDDVHVQIRSGWTGKASHVDGPRDR